jgi:3-phenylpropionate/cinnamic acid dioxygenase small subunit
VTAPRVDRATRQDVAELLVRYATGIDRRDWPLFRSCFTDDCDADYGDIGRWHGADALTSWMEGTHAVCGPTLHRITNQSVERDDGGLAARSYVDAIVMGPDNLAGVRAIGYYDDRLRRGDDGWRIAERTFTMVLVQQVGGG